jgi:hypothetical protein
VTHDRHRDSRGGDTGRLQKDDAIVLLRKSIGI